MPRRNQVAPADERATSHQQWSEPSIRQETELVSSQSITSSMMSSPGDDDVAPAELQPAIETGRPEQPLVTLRLPSMADEQPLRINANDTLDEMVDALTSQKPKWLDKIDEYADAPVVMLFGGLLEGIDCPLYQIKNAFNDAVLAERETKKLAEKKGEQLRIKLGTKVKVEHVYQHDKEKIQVVKYWKRDDISNPFDTTDPGLNFDDTAHQPSEQGLASLSDENDSLPVGDGVATIPHNAPRQNEEPQPRGGVTDAAANAQGQRPLAEESAGETETRPQTGTPGSLSTILPGKQHMLTRVKDSIEALASVFHETRAILVTDYPYHVCEDSNVPVRILLDAMFRLQGSFPRAVLVHNAHRKEEERAELKRKRIFARVEVSNPDRDWEKYPIGVAQARVGMAIAQHMGRPVLSVLVSGGIMCLKQMGAVVKTQRNSPATGGWDSRNRIPRPLRRNNGAWPWDILMGIGNMEKNEEDDSEEGSAESFCIVLQGSGRLADVWRSLWPQRATVEFDPVRVSALLEEEIGYPPDAVGVAQLREILAHGQLALHDISSSSSTLKRLCMLHLRNDETLDTAAERQREYERAKRHKSLPRVAVQGSMLSVAVLATIFSVLDWLPAAKAVSIAFSTVLVLLGLADMGMKLSERERALARAAGAVESLRFRYRARALEFSDAALSRKRAEDNGIADLMTCRQKALAAALQRVNRQVMASGAIVRSHHGLSSSANRKIDQQRGAPISGNRYVELRVKKQLAKSERLAKYYHVMALLFNVVIGISGAAGTLLAYVYKTEYVAIAVAVSSAAQQIMRGWRLSESREAYRKASAVLADVEMRWRALPDEARAHQSEIDRLVGQSERALQSTLPPKPAGDSDYDNGEDDDADINMGMS